MLELAVRSGINLIDTAPWYGHGKSESVLGKGLANIPRASYYLTTKVGRYLPDPAEMFDFRAEKVIRSVDESLQRLGLDYVDVIQVCILILNNNVEESFITKILLFLIKIFFNIWPTNFGQTCQCVSFPSVYLNNSVLNL